MSRQEKDAKEGDRGAAEFPLPVQQKRDAKKLASLKQFLRLFRFCFLPAAASQAEECIAADVIMQLYLIKQAGHLRTFLMTDDLQKLVARSVELLEEVQKIEKTRIKNGVSQFEVNNLASRSANLFQSVTGAKSVYSENLRNALKQKMAVSQYMAVAGVLQAFHLDLSKGYLVNIRHEVESIVVSEILTQAKKLSKTKGVHPAASVIVACAGVEEFLRNWCEEKSVVIPEKQRSIGKFASELRSNGYIDLPVERRVSSWADYRNDAAHGANWGKITQEIANRVIREIEEFILENRKILG